MATTHPIANNPSKLNEEPHAETDQKILNEINRHNHGIAEGFFQRFFKGSPLDNPLKKYAHHLRNSFVSRLPESEEKPDLPGISHHFLFSSTTEYSWAKVQVIGLELDAEYYDHDSGLVQLYKYARKVFRSQPAQAREEGEPWGFLIDLDLSMELAVGPAKPGEIIGTKAFMAIDVMKRRQHSYRHDLESFLYVFLWIAICGGDRKLPADSRLQRWLVGDWSELAQKKTEDMEDGNFAGIVAEFTPQFLGLEGLAYRLRDVLFCEEIGAEELYSAFFSAIDETLALQRF
ncbi:hypothetical protein CEP51_004566 [Fusarium floridanum]|uniref:Fungal-type protein kinase domain-containing protein n=1 Tax=Fusarium floridanum TaxID=1325733 RepID=A0A428S0W1_9HYPO|nr:hypothetical protein CEP51_004566 [Fusarium floridanum]